MEMFNAKSFKFHMTINQSINKLGRAADTAISKGITQMLNTRAWHCVRLKDLNIEKYRGDGTFEKVKARLVAGGHLQDRTLYEGKTESRTVTTCSVFITATIAAI